MFDALLIALFNFFTVALSLFAFQDFNPMWKVLILFLSTGLAIYIWYRSIHLPVLKVKIEYADSFISTMILPALITSYYEKNPGEYELRACVLRVRKKLVRRPPFRIPELLIQHCTPGYSDSELSLPWTGVMGACGRAASWNKMIFYDPKEHPEAAGGMTPQHIEATKHLNSVMAVPIYRPKDENQENVIAVLGLDSQQNISQTKFHEKQFHGIVTTSAALIGAFLP